MSLVNDMLRDLEARRAEELKRPNLQGEVRPLPPPTRSAWRTRLGLPVLLFTTIVLAGALWWQQAGEQAAVTAALVVERKPAEMAQGDAGRPALRPAMALSAPPEVPEVPKAAPVPEIPPAGKSEVPVDPPVVPAPVATVAPVVVETPVKLPPPLKSARTREVPAKPAPVPEKPPATPKVNEEAPARIEVKAVLASSRERADADFRAAQSLMAAGRSAEAAEQLRAALNQEARHVAARQALFRLLIELRRGEEAMRLLGEGLELQPDQVAWAMTLARLQIDRGDLGAAQRTLERSAAHAGRNADYAGFHAFVHYRLGHFREAVALYQNAARLAPGEGRWWFGLGVAFEGEGRQAEAREAFRQAMATGTLQSDLAALAEQKLR